MQYVPAPSASLMIMDPKQQYVPGMTSRMFTASSQQTTKVTQNLAAAPSIDGPNEYHVDRDGFLVVSTPEFRKTSPIGDVIVGSVFWPPNALRLNLLFLTGSFLQMNEHSGCKINVKEALVQENSTVAFAAALCLSIQITAWLSWTDNNFEMIAENWGDDFARTFEQIAIPLQMCFALTNMIAMIYAVLMLLVIGEMSGEAEVESLTVKRGTVGINGAFLMFFISLSGFGIWLLAFSMAYCPTPEARIAFVVIYVTVLFVTIVCPFPGFLGLLKDLHNVKAETMKHIKLQPVVLTRQDVQMYIVKTAKVLKNSRVLSPEIVETYILDTERYNGDRRRLSWMTKKILLEEMDFFYSALYPEEASLQGFKNLMSQNLVT